MRRYGLLTGAPPDEAWRKPIRRAARWIERKLLPADLDKPHAGLLPAGFSAEHLGPNDYYYWDDFWGAAGLASAAKLLDRLGAPGEAAARREESRDLLRSVERSLEAAARRLGRPLMPAAPSRRMDAGAIGSLVAAYPLGLLPPHDERIAETS